MGSECSGYSIRCLTLEESLSRFDPGLILKLMPFDFLFEFGICIHELDIIGMSGLTCFSSR